MLSLLLANALASETPPLPPVAPAGSESLPLLAVIGDRVVVAGATRGQPVPTAAVPAAAPVPAVMPTSAAVPAVMPTSAAVPASAPAPAPVAAPAAMPASATAPAATSAAVPAPAPAPAPVAAPAVPTPAAAVSASRGTARGPGSDAPVDYTAAVLDPGEVRIGLGGVAVGLAGRAQLGTHYLLDALSVPNLDAKVQLVDGAVMDVAVEAAGHYLAGQGLDGGAWGGGVTASLQPVAAWGVHGGMHYTGFTAEGTPNLDPVAPLIELLWGVETSDTMLAELEEGLAFTAHGQLLTARLGTDLRVGARDRFVLQAQVGVWGDADLPVDIPAALAGGEPVPGDASGPIAVRDAYVTSLAWHHVQGHVETRIGAGLSSIPGAWVLPSFDLAYTFGGEDYREVRAARMARRAERRGAVADAARPELPAAPAARPAVRPSAR